MMTKAIEKDSLEAKMAAAQDGDNNAYASLLKEVSSPIRSFLRKSISTDADVEDLLQEVLLSIHKARQTYDPTRPFMPWVISITKFRLNDFLRKHYRSKAKESVDIDDIQETLSEEIINNDDSEIISKALETLPDRQQQIVRLMKIEGYTAKEVGERLNMNVSAVKVAAHRAYKQLKTELEKQGYQ